MGVQSDHLWFDCWCSAWEIMQKIAILEVPPEKSFFYNDRLKKVKNLKILPQEKSFFSKFFH
jgi:hypothetical protein